MVDLPQKKVGIVACSGEEMVEGTVTRLAALKVLEQLRPKDTVTICLPLFLAGGEGDRAFARFYPTIALDGCDKRCAAKATELYSGKPAASVLVTDLMTTHEIGTLRRLNDNGRELVTATADRTAHLVDELLGRKWDRRAGEFIEEAPHVETSEPSIATCACGSGIPVQTVNIDGQAVTLIALPAIFQQFHNLGKTPSSDVARELLDMVKIYNAVPVEQEACYLSMLEREYALYCAKVKA
ncbi:MAG: putative zinc-binding protein [Anaerolineae bacterium]